MRGDFSRFRFDPRSNFTGILQQQGRVLLDADVNDQSLLTENWQRYAGRDAFGTLVAAVPAAVPDSFLVSAATATDSGVDLELSPGRLWADGRMLHLRGDSGELLERSAAPLPGYSAPEAGERDVILLEQWSEEVSGFQVPSQLIEPALGGPDTAQRMQTMFAFRVARMEEGETCEEAAQRLQDDRSDRGQLRVSLQPSVSSGGDCPVVEGGGYTGFEHNLYRIEIAQLDEAVSGPRFKWSPWNGGLVGRGRILSADGKIVITGNKQAIVRSGLSSFYLEMLEARPVATEAEGAEHWELIYGAEATLDENRDLVLGDVLYGTLPAGDAAADDDPPRRFFRLWSAIELVDDFVIPGGSADPEELRDGIRLEFEASSGADYEAGDAWTFTVRAGDIGNTVDPLLPLSPPQMPERSRVALATLTWGEAIEVDPEGIGDCRRVFQPLTRRDSCCRYRVGDGVHSHGDFDTIQAAIDHLPPEGGEICVLEGHYAENLRIIALSGVTIHGCGKRSRIVAMMDEQAAIDIVESEGIRIEGLSITASDDAEAIRLQESEDVEIRGCELAAFETSAIDAKLCSGLRIVDNEILAAPVVSNASSLALEVEGLLVEHNRILGLYEGKHSEDEDEDEENEMPSVCSSHGKAFEVAAPAMGGIWLRGGCADVRIIDNDIVGGRGHGISLGGVVLVKDGEVVDDYPEEGVAEDDCGGNEPSDTSVPAPSDDDSFAAAGPPLREIRIERNRIRGMGQCGIGAMAFFATPEQGVISVEGLQILGNEICDCLLRPITHTEDEMVLRMGYGGIALADVEDLVVYDNRIENNGRDHLEPICGIYVFHGEGIDIFRNVILNNGAQNEEDSEDASQGARGGIFIQLCNAPVIDIDVGGKLPGGFSMGYQAALRGVPAARIHQNVVSTPLGHALFLMALGPVSVQENQFTTLALSPGVLSKLVGSVFILGIGVSPEYLRSPTFEQLLTGNTEEYGAEYKEQSHRNDQTMARYLLRQQAADKMLLGGQAKMMAPMEGASAEEPSEVARALIINDNTDGLATGTGATGLNTDGGAALSQSFSFGAGVLGALASILPTGNVLFAGNQCQLDLRDPKLDVAVSAVMILSLDDVAIENNQFDCSLVNDFVFTNLLTFGMSARIIGNRFKEPRLNALLSIFSYGFLNNTSNNQCSHCVLSRGLRPVVRQGNQVVFTSGTLLSCETLDAIMGDKNNGSAPAGALANANNQPQSVLNLLG